MKFLRSCLAPPSCELCETLVEDWPGLCRRCAESWVELPESRCELCADPFSGGELSLHRCAACLRTPPSFERATCAVRFEGSAVGLLHALKFEARQSALAPLAEKGAESFRQAVADFAPDYMAPMPLGWLRRWRRGFNQSFLLMKALRRKAEVQVPIWQGGRRRTTSPLALLGREQRRTALVGSFRPPPPGSLRGLRLLVVDDVLTTGATAEAFSKCLLQAGAPSVQVFAFARAGRRGSNPP